jgi:hypothetical protein
MQPMTFSEALKELQNGELITRSGWNGKGMFLYLVPGSTFAVNRPPLLGIYPEGLMIHYRAHIDMRTADGSCVPWVASQTDILALDWEVVPHDTSNT